MLKHRGAATTGAAIRRGILVLGAVTMLTPAAVVAQIAVVGDLVVERELAPGESYAGTIRVQNVTDRTQEVRIYQRDIEFGAVGHVEYPEPATQPRSNAAWISLAPTRLVIPARQYGEVAYIVTAPSGLLASAGQVQGTAGTYWSMIMVEAVPEGSAEAGGGRNTRVRVGIRSVTRYAVQVATHLSGPARTDVSFARTQALRSAGGQGALELELVNTGDRGYRPELSLELYRQDGTVAARLRQTRGLLLPGASLRQRFELGDLAPDTYLALVLADTGGDEIFAAQYTLRF